MLQEKWVIAHPNCPAHFSPFANPPCRYDGSRDYSCYCDEYGEHHANDKFNTCERLYSYCPSGVNFEGVHIDDINGNDPRHGHEYVMTVNDLREKVGNVQLDSIMKFLIHYVQPGGMTFDPLDDPRYGKVRSPSRNSDEILSLMEQQRRMGSSYWTEYRIAKYTIILKYEDGSEKRKLHLQADWSNVLSFDVLLPIVNLYAKDGNLTKHDMRSICLYANRGGPALFSCILRSVRGRRVDRDGELVQEKRDDESRIMLPEALHPPLINAP